MNSLAKTAVTSICCMVLVMSAAGPAAAKTCKSSSFIGQAIASSEPQALALARLNWAAKVTSYWGVPWRNYNIAAGKVEQCEAGGAAGLKFSCMADAIPCKAGRRVTGPTRRTN